MTENKTILKYIDSIGMITLKNDMDDIRSSFKNGYKPSIIDVDEDGSFSCAYCDYNGYFDWHYPGTNESTSTGEALRFRTEEEVCRFIKAVSELPAIHE